ncbi:MAG: ComEC family competence protein [Bacteroidetes bacterium]|nr:ComEC family competence protein [Bacteroidota bacterium]
MQHTRSVWNQMPMVRLLLPFMMGIGICIASSALLILFIALLVLSVAFLIWTNLLKDVAAVYRWRYVAGASVVAIMLSLGYTVTWLNTDPTAQWDMSHLAMPATEYEGIITEPPVIREKTIGALVTISGISTGDTVIPGSGKVLASIVRNEKSEALHYGDRVTFRGAVKEYDLPKNPDEFDYRQYQALHHVYHRAYLQPGTWKVIASNEGNALLSRIYAIRGYFLTLIKKHVHGETELAVATALTLGYRDYVTDDVMQAYSASGVLHVLSVSGLHVGVMYFVLNLLLGWMDKRRRTEILKGLIVITVMIFYAGLTGLSPPVLRSVWMFSLLAIAKLLDRDVSIYNVLGLSCFVLLVWDPYYLADVGFQLSYIAVAGIVLIYPLFFGLIPDTDIVKRNVPYLTRALNWLSRWTWGLICVSLAAQLATLPVSLLYFHNFPSYFLLANLAVIPLSNFVLVAGMLLFCVGWIPYVSDVVGWLFDHLLIWTNQAVHTIEHFPHAISRGIMVSTPEMLLLYVVIGLIIWYVFDRRAKVLIAALSALLIVCTAFSYDTIRKDNLHEICVYSVKGKKAISLISRGAVVYDFDTAVYNNDKTMRYHIRDHWYADGVEQEVPMDSAKDCITLPYGKIYAVEGKCLMVIDKPVTTLPAKAIDVDVLVISHGYTGTIDALRQCARAGKIVFDTSITPWQLKKWKKECEMVRIPYHDCAERAFILKW